MCYACVGSPYIPSPDDTGGGPTENQTALYIGNLTWVSHCFNLLFSPSFSLFSSPFFIPPSFIPSFIPFFPTPFVSLHLLLPSTPSSAYLSIHLYTLTHRRTHTTRIHTYHTPHTPTPHHTCAVDLRSRHRGPVQSVRQDQKCKGIVAVAVSVPYLYVCTSLGACV